MAESPRALARKLDAGTETEAAMARLLVALATLGLLVASASASYVESWNSTPAGADAWMMGSGPLPLPGQPALWSPVGGVTGGCVYSYLSMLTMVNGNGAILGATAHPVNFLSNPIVSVAMLDPVLDQPVNCGNIQFGVMGADGGIFLFNSNLPTPTASWTTSAVTLTTNPGDWNQVIPGNLVAALANPAGWGWATTGKATALSGIIVFDNIQVTPEPATLCVLATGALAMLRRRK
jgi:hypothetical protein